MPKEMIPLPPVPIPAYVGFYVVRVCADRGVWKEPVIGWMIEPWKFSDNSDVCRAYEPTPITNSGTPSGDEDYGLLMPGGEIVTVGRVFTSIDDFEESTRKDRANVKAPSTPK